MAQALCGTQDTEAARARAAKLIMEAFRSYWIWQQGDGDAMTFLDWVRDELGNEPVRPDCLHDEIERLRTEKRALHLLLAIAEKRATEVPR